MMMLCFAHNDMVKFTGSESSAVWQIKISKKGYIERVRRELYAVISLETEQAIPKWFQIASKGKCFMCISS